ncbi:hypothetical protein FKM82_000600 [Ascaphus truei]
MLLSIIAFSNISTFKLGRGKESRICNLNIHKICDTFNTVADQSPACCNGVYIGGVGRKLGARDGGSVLLPSSDRNYGALEQYGDVMMNIPFSSREAGYTLGIMYRNLVAKDFNSTLQQRDLNT